MAIRVDKNVREAVKQRLARGHDASIELRLSAGTTRGVTRQLLATWRSRRAHLYDPVERTVDGVTLLLDRRVARYAQWRDLKLTAWQWGPFCQLVVVDEPLVVLDMIRWEHTHPGLIRRPA